MMKGTIKMFVAARKFGFILVDGSSDGDGTEVFFHASNFHGTPVLGERVEFELGPPVRLGRPPMAVNIRLLTGEGGVQ